MISKDLGKKHLMDAETGYCLNCGQWCGDLKSILRKPCKKGETVISISHIVRKDFHGIYN